MMKNQAVARKVEWLSAVSIAFLVSTNAHSGPLPTNNDPSNQIRFNDVAGALAKREQLTNYIWSDGLPTGILPTQTLQSVAATLAGPLSGVNSSLVSTVSRLDADVSGFNFVSTTYLIGSASGSQANRLALVHQGHTMNPLDTGIGETVNELLNQGFTVGVMQLPLFGWNTDNTAVIPGQGEVSYNSHDQMILNTGPLNGGMGFRLFLEPVIQNINFFQTQTNGLGDISMVGLSGGGWAAALASAIDPRIRTSVQVAGSAPLYVRNTQLESVGDLEQVYSPLFAEDIATDGSGGGVATWQELYVLGAFGEGRHQIMVTNEFDNCCFKGATLADPFKDIVSDAVDALGMGNWDYYLDSVSGSHQISNHTLVNVIVPALNASPVPLPPSLALLAFSLIPLRRRMRRPA